MWSLILRSWQFKWKTLKQAISVQCDKHGVKIVPDGFEHKDEPSNQLE